MAVGSVHREVELSVKGLEFISTKQFTDDQEPKDVKVGDLLFREHCFSIS
jgi:hypothetical protein